MFFKEVNLLFRLTLEVHRLPGLIPTSTIYIVQVVYTCLHMPNIVQTLAAVHFLSRGESTIDIEHRGAPSLGVFSFRSDFSFRCENEV